MVRSKLFLGLATAWAVIFGIYWKNILGTIVGFNATLQGWLESVAPTPTAFAPPTDGEVALFLGLVVLTVTVLASIIRNAWRATSAPTKDA